RSVAHWRESPATMMRKGQRPEQHFVKTSQRARYLTALCSTAGLIASGVAFAQAPGERSAVIPTDCNRACLLGFVHSYMDALVHKDPARAHFAKDVRFTENDVEMPLGRDGLWGSISGAPPTGLEVADTTTGNAAWFGTV